MPEPAYGARVGPSGAFCYVDFDEVESVWPTADALARDWWADTISRGGRKGAWLTHAHPLLSELTETGHPSSMDVLQALIDQADTDEELDYIGAGPMEDLLAHSGHGVDFIAEVEVRSRRQARFRKAVAAVWLGSDVPQDVRSRLATLGAKVI